MASIPDFLQESFQGVQKALEQKYKDMILEHEKNISYGLSEEDYTPNYGEIDIKSNIFYDKIIEQRPGRWFIYYSTKQEGDLKYIFIDNHGEPYEFGYEYNITNFDEYMKNKEKFKYPLSNNLITFIKETIHLIREYYSQYSNSFRICHSINTNYQKLAKDYYKICLTQKENRNLRQENKRLLELLTEKGQKSDNLEKSDTPKTILQRFQEKLKAL